MANDLATQVGQRVASSASAAAAGALAKRFAAGEDVTPPEYMSIMGVDGHTMEILRPERTFQWWPETLTDSMQGGWQQKTMPGGSHPIHHWSANSGRTINLELFFSRQLTYREDVPGVDLGSVSSPNTSGISRPLINEGSDRNKPFNVDIPSAVAYMRSFMYPRYAERGSLMPVKPPPVAILNAPNVQLNEDGRDTIWVVMQQCDVTYLKSFPNGRPRLVQLSVSLQQTVQDQNGVNYKGMGDFTQEWDEITGGQGGDVRPRHYRNPRPNKNPIGDSFRGGS